MKLRSQMQGILTEAVMKNYRYDRSRLKTLNDKDRQREEAEEYGSYTQTEIRLIPIKDIKLPPVWGPEKYENAKALIQAKKPLDPVVLSPSGSKWTIVDGIHRTHASRDLGFTHVPAFIETEVQAKKLYKKPDPEKPRLQKGDWVKMHKPTYGGMVYGWVVEPLNSILRKGVKRYRYGLKFIDAQGHLDFGDYTDDEFDTVKPPADVAKARENLGK